MNLKIKWLVFSLILLFFLPGCWGIRETNEMGFVLVTGVDRGEENLVKLTFQLAIPEPLGEEGGALRAETEVVSVESASLFGAQQLINTFISKHITLIHNTAVIVSEEIAQEGLGKYINPLIRSREIRRTNYLLVVKGKASDFIEKNKGLIFEKFPSRQFDTLMSSAGLTGIILDTDIHFFYRGLKSPGRQPTLALAGVQKDREDKDEVAKEKSDEEKVRTEMAYLPGEIPRQGGNKICLIGQAVFKNDKLVGFLDGAETRYYQMVTGMFRRSVFSFKEPVQHGEGLITMRIKKEHKPQIRIRMNEQETVIEVKLFLSGEILSIQSGINYEQGILKKDLETEINAVISREIMALIKKTQEEYGSDIFGFGEYSRGHFATWQDWVNYAWLEQYPFCAVEVFVDFDIYSPGMMVKTAPDHLS